jgi:LacI family transcriptional regulator
VAFVQRVKMADIARTAGVSVATVSKVVNSRYGVAQATVDRVQEVIRQLGYEASLGAQSLRSHRTHVLGILVAEFEPFSTELLKGASRAVADTNYELLAYSGGARGADVGWERRSLSRLSGTLIDGAMIVTPTVVETKPGFHVVAVDPHTGPSGLPTVDSDNFAGAVLATAYLLGLGHRRIGFLGGRPDLESARLREAGFRQARTPGRPSTRRSSASAATGPTPPKARPGSCSPRATDPLRCSRPTTCRPSRRWRSRRDSG